MLLNFELIETFFNDFNDYVCSQSCTGYQNNSISRRFLGCPKNCLNDLLTQLWWPSLDCCKKFYWETKGTTTRYLIFYSLKREEQEECKKAQKLKLKWSSRFFFVLLSVPKEIIFPSFTIGNLKWTKKNKWKCDDI